MRSKKKHLAQGRIRLRDAVKLETSGMYGFQLTLILVRPCTRCVKKGIGDSCVEGVRKKAKYLLDPEDRGRSSICTKYADETLISHF